MQPRVIDPFQDPPVLEGGVVGVRDATFPRDIYLGLGISAAEIETLAESWATLDPSDRIASDTYIRQAKRKELLAQLDTWRMSQPFDVASSTVGQVLHAVKMGRLTASEAIEAEEHRTPPRSTLLSKLREQ